VIYIVVFLQFLQYQGFSHVLYINIIFFSILVVYLRLFDLLKFRGFFSCFYNNVFFVDFSQFFSPKRTKTVFFIKKRGFLKVFFSIYVEFLELNIFKFKEEDYRRLFTLIDSSGKSLINPDFSYQQYREYWIIRIENFYKNEQFSKNSLYKSSKLKRFYLKFLFIIHKVSRMLEIKYIIDEDFKELIKKPNYTFIHPKKRKKLYSYEEKKGVLSMKKPNNFFENGEVEKKLRDFFSLKLGYWQESQDEAISLRNLIHEKDENLTCRICLRGFSVENLKNHSYRCKETAELSQDLIDLRKEFTKAEIFAKELMRKLFLENQLERYLFYH